MKKLFLSTLFISSMAIAQVQFEDMKYSGTGCPKGSVSSVSTPETSTFSVLFDEFRAEVPQYDGINDNSDYRRGPRATSRQTTTVNYRSCALSFIAKLPPGQMATEIEISLQARGVTILDPGVEGQFSSVLVGYDGLARSRGNASVLVSKKWRSLPKGQDDTWSFSPMTRVSINSPCSTDTQKSIRFDLKNHIVAEILNDDLTKHGLLSVDSSDSQSSLKFVLRTTRCGGKMSP